MKVIRKISLSLLLILFASIFAFAQTGSIIGKVRDPKGNSLEGVEVQARQDGKSIQSTETDKKGKFRLSGLQPGKYTLTFDKAGFSTGALRNVEVRAKGKNNLGDRLVMAVDQGTLIIVEASVYNQNGFSLYGAKVEIAEILSDGSTKKVGSGYSSKDGDIVFRFPEKPAKYRITASVKGLSASKELEVNEAAIYRTSITLDLSKDTR
jgi:hypothetical protein